MRSSRAIAASLALAAGWAVPIAPAVAHHSVSAYDFRKTIKLEGTVKLFQWTNPHCWLELVVVDPSGTSTKWTLEAGTPNVNKRMGWNGKDLAAGDKITVTIHPKRDGSPDGALTSVTLPSGKTLSAPASIIGAN